MAYDYRSDERLVNTATAGPQERPSATAISADRVLVVWVGRSADNQNLAAKGQMYDNAGNKVGSEITYAQTGSYDDLTVVARPNGYSVAWGAGALYVYDYDFQNNLIGGRYLQPDFAELSAATLADGSQVYAGSNDTFTSTTGSIVRPDGAVLNFSVSGRSPAIAALADGRFVVTTATQSGTGYDTNGFSLRAQIFSATGQPIGAQFPVNSTIAGNQNAPAAVGLEGGGFVVVWGDSGVDGSGTAIRGQVFDANGAKVGSEFAVNTVTAGNQTAPTVTATSDGGFLVSWTDASGVGDSSGTGIKARLFTSAGVASGDEFLVNTTTANDQNQPFVASSQDGDVFVVWTDYSGADGDAAPPAVKLRIVSDAITGSAAGETLVGTPGDDVIRAGGGNDTVLVQQGGNDQVEGGDGDDVVYFGQAFSAQDSVDGGAGRDVVALQGTYFLQNFGPDTLRNVEVLSLMTASDNAYGGATGTATTYTIQTHDSTVAAGSAFTLEARALQADEEVAFFGQAETDGKFALYGGRGIDSLYAGAGDDILDGGGSADTLSGGLGSDIYFVDNAGDKVIDGGTGFDQVYTTVNYKLGAEEEIELLATTNSGSTSAIALTGNRFSQSIIGTNGNDTLRGEGGNDYLVGNGGDDQLYASGNSVLAGGTGDDSYFVQTWFQVLNESAGQGFDIVYTNSAFVLLGDVEVELLIYQGSGPVALYGNGFAQEIRGGIASDSIEAGGGNDVLIGYGGDDYLDGGAGADLMQGGDGSDIYFVDQAGDQVVETGGGFDSVYASGSFALAAGSEIELLATTNSAGSTSIDLTGSSLAQTIIGNGGVNRIVALGGNDFVQGMGGDDVLDGGAGDDILEGGAGADIFRFAATSDTVVSSGDQIRDFVSGTDKIDLSLIDANTAAAGDQAFTYIGTGAFTGQAGQLRYEVANGQVHLSGDVNGDGIADFQIVLNNTTIIAANDFIL